jgi:hypothetical protein
MSVLPWPIFIDLDLIFTVIASFKEKFKKLKIDFLEKD